MYFCGIQGVAAGVVRPLSRSDGQRLPSGRF